MSAAWEVMCAWGVPEGPVRVRPSGPFPSREIARAISELAGDRFATLLPVQRECLRAWLRAFRHEWPRRFESILGIVGHQSIAALDDVRFDPNRSLKLRRIAIENLAGIL
jgi:hypothetical protein